MIFQQASVLFNWTMSALQNAVAAFYPPCYVIAATAPRSLPIMDTTLRRLAGFMLQTQTPFTLQNKQNILLPSPYRLLPVVGISSSSSPRIAVPSSSSSASPPTSTESSSGSPGTAGTSAGASATSSPVSSSKNSDTETIAIAAGVAGGVVALIVVVAIVCCCCCGARERRSAGSAKPGTIVGVEQPAEQGSVELSAIRV